MNSVARLMAVLAAMETATPSQHGIYGYRARLTAREVMAKVIRDVPAGAFSMQLNTLRETI